MVKATDFKGGNLGSRSILFRQQGFHGPALHDVLAACRRAAWLALLPFPRRQGGDRRGRAGTGGRGRAAEDAPAAEASDGRPRSFDGHCRAMAAELENRFLNGCPIATTALEPQLNRTCWRRRARAHSRVGSRRSGRGLWRFGAKPDDAATAASAIFSQIEGALLLARPWQRRTVRRGKPAVKVSAGHGHVSNRSLSPGIERQTLPLYMGGPVRSSLDRE